MFGSWQRDVESAKHIILEANLTDLLRAVVIFRPLNALSICPYSSLLTLYPPQHLARFHLFVLSADLLAAHAALESSQVELVRKSRIKDVEKIIERRLA